MQSDLREGLSDGLPGAALMLCHRKAKGREQLRKAVASWNVLAEWYRRERQPGRVVLTVGGYDEDRRELWEVPSVVGFVVAWAVKTGIIGPPANGEQPLTVRDLPQRMLSPETVDLLLALFQAAAGHPGPFRNVAPCDARWRRTFAGLMQKR